MNRIPTTLVGLRRRIHRQRMSRRWLLRGFLCMNSGLAALFVLRANAFLLALDNAPPTSAPSDATASVSPAAVPVGANDAQTEAPIGVPNTAAQSETPAAPNPPAEESPSTSAEWPALPAQALNNSPLYATAVGNSAYPTFLNSPALSDTGAFSLSQVAANAALQGAFLGGGVISSTTEPDQSPSPLDRIELGPIDLKAALNVSFISDDNIDAQPPGPQRVSDVEMAITPAVLLTYGTRDGQRGYASLIYAPTLNRFFQHSAENSDDQNVALSLQYPLQRLTLDAAETYAEVTGVNLDARARTTQSTELASFGGNYDIDDSLSAQSHFEYRDTTYTAPGGTAFINNTLVDDARESWSSSAIYRVNDNLNFGPGVTLGLEKPAGSPQQTFERGLLNVNYQATDKILVDGQAGVEWRQYAQDVDRTNPVFSAGILYQPTEAANVSVRAFSEVVPTSNASDETDTNTGVTLNLSEKLFQRLTAGFALTYLHTDYSSNGSSQPGGSSALDSNGGSQDNIAYRPSLTLATSQWSSVALYYQYLDNETTTQGEGYHDNQLGISLSAQF